MTGITLAQYDRSYSCSRINTTHISCIHFSSKKIHAKVVAWLAPSLLCERDPSGDYISVLSSQVIRPYHVGEHWTSACFVRCLFRFLE